MAKELSIEVQRSRAIVAKIKHQFIKTGHGSIMLAVVERAIIDSVSDGVRELRYRGDARRYLKGNMIHCEIAGVSPDWVKSVINKIDLGFKV